MASVNKVIILGNLGRDPENPFFRKQPSNHFDERRYDLLSQKCRNSGARRRNGMAPCGPFSGRQAEIAQQYLKKGSRVYLEGRLRTRKWEKDGQTHYSTEILADTLQLIDRKSDVVGGGQLRTAKQR